MLLKLLKYDFRRTFKFYIPILATSLVVGSFAVVNSFILGGKVIMLEQLSGTQEFITLIAFLGIYSSIMVLTMCTALIGILNFISYYRSMFTRRAYLEFSYPVKPSLILMSKLITAYTTWFSVTVVVACSIILCYFNIFSQIIIEESPDIIEQLMSNIGSIIYFIIMIILNVFVMSVFSLMLEYFLPLFGYSIAKKRKTLSAILWTVGGLYVAGIIGYIAEIAVGTIAVLISDFLSKWAYVFAYIGIAIPVFVFAGLSVVLWFGSRAVISKLHELQ